VKQFIKDIPFIGPFILKVYFSLTSKRFAGSAQYWDKRYQGGGTSGSGAYNKLANYKATVINTFVAQKKVQSIIEYGCGDGNQLSYADYPSYLGFDVSPHAIALCQEKFAREPNKQFKLVQDYDNERAQLTLSLDVIYHLVEDAVFESYMARLFASSDQYVAIYSSNTTEQQEVQSPHVRHRKFSDWVDQNACEWKLLEFVKNAYPFTGDDKEGSFCDFYFYTNKPAAG
jgi:hypothetical protein